MSVSGLQGVGYPMAGYPTATACRNNMKNVFGKRRKIGNGQQAAVNEIFAVEVCPETGKFQSGVCVCTASTSSFMHKKPCRNEDEKCRKKRW